MNKLIIKTISVIAFALLAGCAAHHDSGSMHNPTVPGCNAKNVVIQIKLDSTTNTPKLVEHGQNTVCVESGNKISWVLVETPGPNRDFTIFFKDGSFTQSTTNGKVDFNKTSVTTITAYSYGIKMPGAKELDPIVIIIPSFGN